MCLISGRSGSISSLFSLANWCVLAHSFHRNEEKNTTISKDKKALEVNQKSIKMNSNDKPV